MRAVEFKRVFFSVFGGLGLTAAMSVSAADPLKVGFVYTGPVGDHGWTYQHDQGRKGLEQALGDKVKTMYVENVADGADSERVVRNMAQGGYDLIFGTSFGYMNSMASVSRQFPDVTFEHATGYKRSDNLGTYLSGSYEGRYVAGYLAAKMTKSNIVGYVASFPIPEVIRDINAIQLALNKYNPGAVVKVVWISTWFDPGKESDAANVLIDQGADVIFQHTASPAPIQAAQRRGVYSVGYASDMGRFGPDSVITSIEYNWEPFYVHTAQAVLDGEWVSDDYWGGLADDALKMPMSSIVPEAYQNEAQEIIASIKDGSFHPFDGPVLDQKGEIRVPAGVSANKTDLASMDYYVQGIAAEFPQR
ncbi:MAG: BMP family ABC transporter substrate-binding protein [Pseudomonas sp.]|jgi:simple sugar transport system substrate-binding protein|nr:BMP family ABC transporter substrate-binding protein [Pseudomonas sp.]MBB52216.1 BMP family ABC transporter substrate-binding protein [Pseudomonadales bacterium]|tara:strand:- start:1837 stop:2922 length:1086 start_codon:yes stop_codon:yes gene_type:complete